VSGRHASHPGDSAPSKSSPAQEIGTKFLPLVGQTIKLAAAARLFQNRHREQLGSKRQRQVGIAEMVSVLQAQHLLDLRSLHRAAYHEDQPFNFLEDLSDDLPGNQPSAIDADRPRALLPLNHQQLR